jgi:histidine triad (HIT) family protein
MTTNWCWPSTTPIPGWETHIVVVPKKHIRLLTTLGIEDEPIGRRLLEVVQRVARDVELQTGSAGIMTFTGDYQHFKHLHIHVRSGEALA